MKHLSSLILFLFFLSFLFPSSILAQIRITEYMYSGSGDEFIEFTNVGGSSVNMSGYSYDDNSRAAGTVDLSAFGTVLPGESVILTEGTATGFRTAWSLAATVKVIGGLSANLGRGDEINLYDNSNTLVDRLTYDDQTIAGSIRAKDQSGWTDASNLGNNDITTWVLSTVGDAQGSYSSTPGDIGNPGTYGSGSSSPTAELYLNEIAFNLPSTDEPKEYIELRGTPGGTIGSGTYLVVIEGDASANRGNVEFILDLSALTIGSNGYLVFLQNGSTYTTDVSASVQTPGSGTGFGGFGFHVGGNSIENGSKTIFLIESASAPTTSNDIDSNDDGVADGSVFSGWTILDEIGMLDGGSGDASYASLVYGNDSDGSVPAGATRLDVGYVIDYFGRNGLTSGSTLIDWVVSNDLSGSNPNYSLNGSAVDPAYRVSAALDHIGSLNFPPSSVDQLAIWTFDALSGVVSGTPLSPTAEDARGVPFLQQFFQDIDDSGKTGTAYTDVETVSHTASRAIAWDDIKGSGDDAELWITLNTMDWYDLALRFDYRVDDDDDGAELPYDLEYSTDGGFTWTKVNNNGTLTDDDTWLTESIDLVSENALEFQPCVLLRFSEFDEDGNNEFVFDNIEITGKKFAPSSNAPAIAVNTSSTTSFLELNEFGGGFVSAVISDPTDPAATQGIDFSLTDANNPLSSLSLTATSSNTAVVPNTGLSLSGTGGSRNLLITPSGVGYTDITVTVSDGTYADYYLIKYAASAQLPPLARCHTGASDASTAISIDADYMLVADDEDEIIRLYDRANSGLPVKTFDFTQDLELEGRPREVDLEASTRVGNRIYWLGSHSNNSDGEERLNRSRMFATDLGGSGASSTLTFVDFYEHLEADLVSWDVSNGHGLGANFLGLAASSADGKLPEAADGFNIEGLAMAPGSSTSAYVGFRAPIVPASSRTKALIVPVTNFTSLPGASLGTATFGTPIQLELGGRGIRSLERNASGDYLIVAGPSGSAGPPPNDFQLYLWDGNSASTPELVTVNPALSGGISFESIVEMPDPIVFGSEVQMLADNGDNDWYNDANRSKDLPQDNLQKFCSGMFTLEICSRDTISPVAVCQDLSLYLPASGKLEILASDIDNGSSDNCGIETLSLDKDSLDCGDLSTAPLANGLIISEYIEGSGNNKAIEIFNGTGSSVDLSNYELFISRNGGTSTSVIAMNGTLVDGEVYVIANPSANSAISAEADATSGNINWNGDDAIALRLANGGANVDIFGTIGQDPGSAWMNGGLSAANQTLRRKGSVLSGISTNPASGFPTLAAEWDEFPQNNSDDLGSHSLSGSGGVVITLTVTDSSNNSSSCTANISLEDTLDPVVSCTDITLYVDANGQASIVESDVTASASDNCEVVDTLIDRDLFYCADILGAVNIPELFISEYVEGTSFNKCVEIYNGTGAAIDLGAGGYVIEVYFNGNKNPGTTVALSGTVADGSTFVLCHNQAIAAFTSNADQTTPSNLWNGDDAVVLKRGGVILDIFGVIGNDPGSSWTASGNSTANQTLRRQAFIHYGVNENPTGTGPAAFATLGWQWTGFPNNDASGIGSHAVTAASPSQVTVTVIDPSGNTGTCTSTVTVKDSTPPQFSCPPSIDNVCDISEAPPIAEYYAFLSEGGSGSDNCAVDPRTFALVSSNQIADCPGEVHLRTYEVYDVNGNRSACVRRIEVQPCAGIGDFVYDDLNRDGLQNPGEPGIPGVIIELYEDGGLLLERDTTDANGHYFFDSLCPKTYYLRFYDLPQYYIFSTQHVGPNDTIDSDPDPLGYTVDLA